MQKIIGFSMILSGCWGLGYWYSKLFQKQMESLKEFCRILEVYLGQIRFGKCTLPECCLQLVERVEEPYKQIFVHIGEEAYENRGESFGDICERYLEEGLKAVTCLQKDKELFIKCFTKSGYEEDVLQLRMIEQTRAELEDRLRVTAEENTEKCKLALSLGTMSGLLLVILFL